MRNRKRARQLQAASIGVLQWQQKFWLLLVEHALAEKLGPPDLSILDGFCAPAVTQYTVTTPDLMRSFRKYNAGRPYHRQVRPFGFMVMFQQADDSDPSTIMRVIAPFNRNPAKAARKAFDRDTGTPVGLKRIKTYVSSLRTYFNHPEAKFLNGERGNRGPTRRRHIIVRSIVHIGKEANKLDIQSASGIDPDAQVEFEGNTGLASRLKAAGVAISQIGVSRVAREADISRKHISMVANGSACASQGTLSDIERAISSLEIADKERSVEVERVRTLLWEECNRNGLRQVASRWEISPSSLSRFLSGQRRTPFPLVMRVRQVHPAPAS
jgi:hypothetical protein